MKKIILIMVMFLILMIHILLASHKVVLPQLTNPHHLNADSRQLYISGKTSIHTFSLPDCQFQKTFGQKGEGPGEFREYFDVGLMLHVASDKLFIASRGRVTLYSKTGEFIRETRSLDGFHHQPIKGGYVGLNGINIEQTFYNEITLFNTEFKALKALHRKKHWFQQGKKIDPINVRNPRFYSWKNRIYVEDQQAGVIRIFNHIGKEIGITKTQIKLLKITPQNQAMYHEYYRTHPYYKDRYYALKHLVEFPPSFPPIKYFDVADQFIYVFTYIKKEGKLQLLVFDLDGKHVKEIFISIPDIDTQAIYPLIKVANKTIYQVIENEDEEWEILKTPILINN